MHKRYTPLKNKRQQFDGCKSATMVSVPKGVARAADLALDLTRIGFVGATETGWKRAHQLSKEDNISIKDVRFIRNWYARHVFASYPGYKKWADHGKPQTKEWFNKRAVVSWLTWGGDAGLKWINSKLVLRLLNTYYDTSYTAIVIGFRV
jgi:hypothetical protein